MVGTAQRGDQKSIRRLMNKNKVNPFSDWLRSQLAAYQMVRDAERGTYLGLARLLNVDYRCVQNWIDPTYRFKPKDRHLERMAEIYSVDIGILKSMFTPRRTGPKLGSKTKNHLDNLFITDYFRTK